MCFVYVRCVFMYTVCYLFSSVVFVYVVRLFHSCVSSSFRSLGHHFIICMFLYFFILCIVLFICSCIGLFVIAL